MDSIVRKIDGHTIEIRYSGSGSIDPWTGDYARELGVGLMGTCDVRNFVLVDGNLIYRLRHGCIPFMASIENLSFEEVMDILSTYDSFGTLEDSKKEIDELKIENDKVKEMTPEEKRAYFEEKKRKRNENKGK